MKRPLRNVRPFGPFASFEQSDTGLEGKRIVEVRPMTGEEVKEEFGTFFRGSPATVLILSDGTKLFPASDPEGNGPGALFGTKDGRQFRL
jgi:hypothetical protein